MKIITLCLLLWCAAVQAETYTEFYIIKSDPTNNLNAGSTQDLTPNFVYGGGNWTNTTCTFRVASGNPLTDGVTNGAWASIYTTAGATVATCVGIVSNVTATFITLDTNTVPSTAALPSTAVGATTCKIGGCWAGPNTNQNPSITFPWAFMAGTLTNSPNNVPCYNWKTGIYGMTNAVTAAGAVGTFPFRISGYGTTPRDGVSWTNDGSAYGGPSFTMVTLSAQNVFLTDIALMNNGKNGSGGGILISGGGTCVRRIMVSEIMGTGIAVSGQAKVEGFDVYHCNKGTNSNLAGFKLAGGGAIGRFGKSHDNTGGGKGTGYAFGGGGVLQRCMAYYNSANGIVFTAPGLSTFEYVDQCDVYSNGLAGVDFVNIAANQANVVDINNSQFFRNQGMAITNTGKCTIIGTVANCVFGSGTMTNLAGKIASSLNLSETNSLTYTANLTPWVDPDNGNFSQSATSLARGRGGPLFYETTINSPTNTVSYLDVGATQSNGTNASGGAYTFSQ